MLVHELFLKTARSFPEAEALSFNGVSLTYAMCTAQVERLAQGLAKHLPRGSRVAINTFKSIDTLLMMLACVQTGFTYVPIDASCPMKHRRFILRDSKARALMVDTQTALDWQLEHDALASLQLIIGSPFSLRTSARHLTLQELVSSSSSTIGSKFTLRLPGEDELAYILYTSGPAGEPKGVMITHRNIAAFVDWASMYFDVHPGDRVAVHVPLHFNLLIFDIYVSLAQGATVCPVAGQTIPLAQAILRFLQDERITVLYASPSTLMALATSSVLTKEDLPCLRLLLYTGAEFHPTSLAKLVHTLPQTRVFNLYGSIETNVATVFEIFPEHLRYQRIPLGRPIFNTRIFLRDEAGQIVDDINKEGEILVSGPSVSPGYLNRPDLTAQSWVELIFRDRHWRCYRTFDFARWDERGILHFLRHIKEGGISDGNETSFTSS